MVNFKTAPTKLVQGHLFLKIRLKSCKKTAFFQKNLFLFGKKGRKHKLKTMYIYKSQLVYEMYEKQDNF